MKPLERVGQALLPLLLLTTAAFAGTPPAKPDLTPLAHVNDEIVTIQDMVDQFTARHGGHAKFLGGNGEARSFLNILIDERLLIQEAYEIGLDREPSVVEAVAEFEKIKAANFLVDREITQKSNPSKEEVHAVWESSLDFFLHIRQIAVETRTEAEEIRTAILHGADVDALARGCSQVESSKNGGHLLVNWGQFEPEWERVVFKLEPGEVSPVIETRNGYEIVIGGARVDATRPELSKVDSQIESVLRIRRTEERKKAFADQLWQKYHVVVTPFSRTPAEVAKALATAPDTTVATWDGGGKLALHDVFSADYLRTLRDFPPHRAEVEIDSRLRTTLNEPLVAAEVKERKIAELPDVEVQVRKFREQAIESLLFSDHIFKEVAVSAGDVQKYYDAHKADFQEAEQRHVAQILVANEADAKAVCAKLAAGSDFAEVAKKSSRDFLTAMSGGELGWITKDKVPDAFKDVLALSTGEWTKPIQSKNGWHVIKVLEIKPPRQLPLAEVRERAEKATRGQKQQEARTFWLTRLRAAAKIDIDDAAIAAFVRANQFTGEAPPQHAMQ